MDGRHRPRGALGQGRAGRARAGDGDCRDPAAGRPARRAGRARTASRTCARGRGWGRARCAAAPSCSPSAPTSWSPSCAATSTRGCASAQPGRSTCSCSPRPASTVSAVAARPAARSPATVFVPAAGQGVVAIQARERLPRRRGRRRRVPPPHPGVPVRGTGRRARVVRELSHISGDPRGSRARPQASRGFPTAPSGSSTRSRSRRTSKPPLASSQGGCWPPAPPICCARPKRWRRGERDRPSRRRRPRRPRAADGPRGRADRRRRRDPLRPADPSRGAGSRARATRRSCTSASRERGRSSRRTTRIACCSSTRAPGVGSCASRAATRSCSGAAARRRSCCSEAGIPFEVVPGVTAGIAAPAYAGIPVTHRDVASGVAFVTGHEDPEKPESAIDWAVARRVPRHAGLLHGRAHAARGSPSASSPAADRRVSRSPSSSAARSRASAPLLATLADVAERAREERVRAPAITLVGEVAAMREQLAWLEHRPLHGRTVAVTRARAQASALAARLRSLGAAVIEAPAIRIEPLDTPLPPLERLRPRAASRRPTAPSCCSTACATRGSSPAGRSRRSARALPPRSAPAGSRPTSCPSGRSPRGWSRRSPTCRPSGCSWPEPRRGATCCPTRSAPAARRSTCSRSTGRSPSRSTTRPARPPPTADYLLFTSASSVRFFAEAAGDGALDGPRLASIGPATSAALRERGAEPHLEADPHTPDGLVDALLADA